MKKLRFFLILAIFMALSAESALSLASDPGRIHYDLRSNPDKVLVTAHRGAHRDYPENSIASVREAIRLGVDIVEIDVRATKDRVAVIMHDSTVDRTANGTGKVSDMTFEQIRRLRLTHNGVATDEKIPSLDELLELAKGRIAVDVDFKADVSFAGEVCDAIAAAGMEGQTLFFLYDYRRIPALKELSPAIQIMPRAYSRDDVNSILSLDKNAPVIHIDKSFYDDAFFGGLPRGVRIWSNALGEYDGYKDTKEGLRQMMRDMPLVNVIQTDRPAELLEVLEEGRPGRFESRITKNEDDRRNRDGKTTVSGQVFNAAGEPIIAEIQIHRGMEYSPWRFSVVKIWATDRDGKFSFEVPAPYDGFRLMVLKGSEYEYLEIPFDVQAGRNTSIDVNLARIIEDQTLEGWYSGDAHQHSGGELGSDGVDTFKEVAYHNVATGNHWGTLSEHRHMKSTDAFVEEAIKLPTDFTGNGGRFFPLIGYEWGWSGQGHMNVLGPGSRLQLSSDIPVDDPMQRNALHGNTILEFQAAGSFVQANHPTADGGLRFMVGDVDFDRAWFVDAFEVWNGDGDLSVMPYGGTEGAFSSFGTAPFEKWFDLLNLGARMAGTATSDSHQRDLPNRERRGVTMGSVITGLTEVMNSDDGSLDRQYYDNGGFDFLWTMIGGDDSGFDPDKTEGYAAELLSESLRQSLRGLCKAAAKEVIARAFATEVAPRISLFANAMQSGAIVSGNTKTYVHIPDAFSESALMEGLRNGRSFMSNGPILRAALNGQEPDNRYGHEAILNSDETATLSIDLMSNRNIDYLYVIVDGKLLQRIPVDGKTGRYDITLNLAGRKWILVDARGERFAKAMTNPIFLATENTKDVMAAKAELAGLVRSVMQAYPEVELVGLFSPEQPPEMVDVRHALDAAIRPVLFNDDVSKQQVDIAIEYLKKAYLALR